MKAICSLKKIRKCVLISNGSEKWHNCIDYNIYEEKGGKLHFKFSLNSKFALYPGED